MAPPSPLAGQRRSRHLRAPAPLRCGASAAQASLAKIIAVISTVRPPAPQPMPPPRRVHDNSGGGDPEGEAMPPTEVIGLGGVDLSLRLGSLASKEMVGAEEAKKLKGDCPAESADALTVEKSSLILSPAEAEDSISPEASVAGGVASTLPRSSVGERDPEEEQEQEEKDGDESEAEVALMEEEATEEESRFDGFEEENAEKTTIASWWRGGCRRPEGYLDMLLDAIRKISGPFPGEEADQSPESTPHSSRAARRSSSTTAATTAATAGERSAKRKESSSSAAEWIPYELYDEAAPIVRSKRGRSQALPSRYRDSVLEPWRKPPTVCRPPKHN